VSVDRSRPSSAAARASAWCATLVGALLGSALLDSSLPAHAASSEPHTSGASSTASAGAVDDARLRAADREPANWFAPGRDRTGAYYSPLAKIDTTSVAQLGFAWTYDLGAPQRGQEATPLVIDGVMYTSGTWGYVYALDAASGRERWRYDPKPDYFFGRNPCCDLVNRGVAVWKGRVYVASGDGRLHALDAATGKRLWVVDTITDHTLPYASTGAPLIAGDLVVIGNGGADMGKVAVRGYLSAYDWRTGALRWRFYTVPGAPGAPFENPELAPAAKTWDEHRDPKFKGGGTVWDGMAYDADLNLVYFGTANAAPYDLRQLGPNSHLDGLYAASIIALDARSGRMAWFYQTTPNDHWDFDAVQKMILTDLTISGRKRAVLMQANKNGFFYVIDRRTGELLAANNYTYVNWASAVDLKSGRPQVTPAADWYAGPKNVYPSWAGGHTWNPMSYDPHTGLVYIPVVDTPSVWVDMLHNGGEVKFLDGFFTVNGIFPDESYDAAALAPYYGPLPSLASIKASRSVKPVRELIRAWDPVQQKIIWEHETSSGMRGYDGGILSTAGNLVFQGRGSGGLWVYAADTGKVLKVIETGSHIMAAPSTYEVAGEQYIAVQVGYGGTGIAEGPITPSSAATRYENTNRIIALKLGGGPVPTPPARITPRFEQPPPQTASAAEVHAGEIKFIEECSRCHALGLNVTPDLRRLDAGLHAAFKDIVLHGLLAPAGMERFDDLLSEKDVENIHAYLIEQAWMAYKAQQAAP
jgi:quinohemoprotein ethanol dehydrogenase